MDTLGPPDYQGVLIFQVILYDEVQFIRLLFNYSKSLDYAGVLAKLIFKNPH